MADNFDYTQLDPGIRDTVRLLRAAGFVTTDSGDGCSKPPNQREMDFPHVAAVCRPYQIHAEAHRMADLLGPDWVVEATYYPTSGDTVLFARLHG